MGPELKTILLVEDVDADARLLRRAFEKADVQSTLVAVQDGAEAIAYLLGQGAYRDRSLYPRPGMMILDIKMPQRDGFEVLDWTRRQQPAFRRLPIVVLATSCASHDVDRAYELGANSYLCKPQRPREWLDLAEAFKNYWIHANEDPDPIRGNSQ